MKSKKQSMKKNWEKEISVRYDFNEFCLKGSKLGKKSLLSAISHLLAQAEKRGYEKGKGKLTMFESAVAENKEAFKQMGINKIRQESRKEVIEEIEKKIDNLMNPEDIFLDNQILTILKKKLQSLKNNYGIQNKTDK